MIDKTIVTDDVKVWLFDYDNPEWERVRSMCLEEDNWLRQNYLPNRCKITDHKVFFIVYKLDGDPFFFGGIKEYTPHVARAFNRMYAFPKYRSAEKIRYHHGLMYNTVLPAMEEALGFKYDLLFISMQMRERRYAGEQRWWSTFKRIWFSWATDWKPYEGGLVQTYPSEDLSCFQNVVYREAGNYTFNDWAPKTITYDEYNERCKNL